MRADKNNRIGRPHITLPDDMVIREAVHLHLLNPASVLENRALRMAVENSAIARREAAARAKTRKQFDYKQIAAGDTH